MFPPGLEHGLHRFSDGYSYSEATSASGFQGNDGDRQTEANETLARVFHHSAPVM